MRAVTFCLRFAATLFVLMSLMQTATADEAGDRAALEAAAQAWTKAFNARDVDALVARSTPDIVLIDAAMPSPASGRAAARDAWARALLADAGGVKSATKEAVISGDVAWRIGALTHTFANSSVAMRSQSLEIWKRVGGEWKLHRQMSSGLLAPAPLSQHPSQPIYDKPTN